MPRIETWPKGEPFDHLPTFDALKERSGLKAYALRVRLKAVPCFKCADNSVRYDEAAAAEALEPDPTGDELEDSDAPATGDPVQTALHTTNKTLALFASTVRTLNDTIKVMGEPQKRGIELVDAAVAVLTARLEKYDAQWDRMVLLLEELQSTQAEREAKQQRATEQAAMRKDTFEMAKKVLPDALEKFALTFEATAALDLLRSVDPDILEGLLKPDVGLVPDEQIPKATKLIALLRAHKQAKEAKSNAAKPAATSAPEPTTSTTNGAAEKVPHADAG